MCGDVGTIRRHLETLRTRAPEVLPLYRELALAALPFGVESRLAGAKPGHWPMLRQAPAVMAVLLGRCPPNISIGRQVQ
jgi:hypothetical protein